MTHAPSPRGGDMAAVEHSPEGLATLRDGLQGLKEEPGSLLEALHLTQEIFGYVTPESIDLISEELGYPEAHVFGVVTFYTLFYTEPQPKYILRVCRDLSCHIAGAPSIAARFAKECGAHSGESSADGLFKLELVSCIGQCEKQPAMMVNLDVHGPMSEEGVTDLVNLLRREET